MRVAAVLCGLLGFASVAQAQSQTYVAPRTGTDNATCPITAPCQTLSQGIIAVAAGGTVVIIEPGPLNPVDVTKSLTIDGTGVSATLTAGITAYGSDDLVVIVRNVDIDVSNGAYGLWFVQGSAFIAENVRIRTGTNPTNAGVLHGPAANGTFVLKNVTVIGKGSANGPPAILVNTSPGTQKSLIISDSLLTRNSRGIVVDGSAPSQVSISNTTISNSAGHGVYVNQTAGSTNLTIKDSQIVNNAGIGVMVYPKGSAAAKVSIVNSAVDGNNIGIRSSANGSTGTVVMAIADTSASNNVQNGIYTDGKTNANIIRATVSGNQNGISAVAPSIVRVGDSLISGNAVGLQGPISSYGNNQLLGNTTQGAKTPVTPGSVP